MFSFQHRQIFRLLSIANKIISSPCAPQNLKTDLKDRQFMILDQQVLLYRLLTQNIFRKFFPKTH